MTTSLHMCKFAQTCRIVTAKLHVCFLPFLSPCVPICTQEFVVYTPYGSTIDTPAKTAFLQILSNLVVLNTLVPISLYVRSVNVIYCKYRHDSISAILMYGNYMYIVYIYNVHVHVYSSNCTGRVLVNSVG